uniref:Zinc finger and BTB domain-containing protein 48-like n=1 Tax=Sinocyclocheilus rhinocerous TaxID=307959 RepID=A0A673KZV5_9TELE
MEILAEGTSHAQRVLSLLNQQRGLGHFCDAMLSTASGQVHLAHRSVLACFSHLFQDPSSNMPCIKIELPLECPDDGLELLLNFFYTGELQLDDSNLEKIQNAASGLSVPDSLIPCQSLPGVENLQSPVSSEDDKDKPLFPLTSADAQPDHTPKGKTRSWQRTKNKSDACRVGSEVDGSVDNQNDNDVDNDDDDDDDDDSDRGDSMDILIEGTDEEYVPHDSPCSTSKTPRGKRKRHEKRTNKENGEETSKDRKKGSVQCPTCHKTFLSKYYLKVHNRRHTGEKPFECAKCGKCYYRKENLLEHEARNCLIRAEVVFSCSKCTMTFKKRHELRLHTVTHTGEMPNKCTSCPEQFMQKKDLRIHMIKVHGAPKPHACPLCPKCFLSRTELRLHEAAKHRGEKLFVCEECGHRASSRNGLQMHIKAIHRNERPFVCEFCNHAFTQKANLNMHLRTHTGEKPFQCHLCGKTFRTQASLDKHHRTHTGERPYSCEFCEQRFTEKGPLLRHIAHLRRHSQIHNRVENYNPRQRRLRNLVVEDESAAASSSPPSQAEAQAEPADMVNLVIQPEVVVVEQVISASAGGTGGEQATCSMTDGAVSGEQTETGRTDGGVEQTPFTVADVMEQTLLVTDAYPIHQSSVVVELPSSAADGKV